MLFACTSAITCHLNIHTILAQQTLHILMPWVGSSEAYVASKQDFASPHQKALAKMR
jgi:hypothetical protein